MTNVDVAALAGGENKALEIDLSVTASGGQGLNVSLVAEDTG